MANLLGSPNWITPTPVREITNESALQKFGMTSLLADPPQIFSFGTFGRVPHPCHTEIEICLHSLTNPHSPELGFEFVWKRVGMGSGCGLVSPIISKRLFDSSRLCTVEANPYPTPGIETIALANHVSPRTLNVAVGAGRVTSSSETYFPFKV